MAAASRASPATPVESRVSLMVRSTLELFNNLFNPVAVNERGIDVYVELGSYRNLRPRCGRTS